MLSTRSRFSRFACVFTYLFGSYILSVYTRRLRDVGLEGYRMFEHGLACKRVFPECVVVGHKDAVVTEAN